MKVCIQNDGEHFYNTRITSCETGQEMQYVSEATIHYKADQPIPTAELTIIYPVVDIIADAEIKCVCPCCGRSVDAEGKPTP